MIGIEFLQLFNRPVSGPVSRVFPPLLEIISILAIPEDDWVLAQWVSVMHCKCPLLSSKIMSHCSCCSFTIKIVISSVTGALYPLSDFSAWRFSAPQLIFFSLSVLYVLVDIEKRWHIYGEGERFSLNPWQCSIPIHHEHLCIFVVLQLECHP